jgi:hypothetical protein
MVAVQEDVDEPLYGNAQPPAKAKLAANEPESIYGNM